MIKTSPKVLKNFNFFKTLESISPKKCHKRISSATPLELAALVEVAFNTLRARLPLSKRERKRLTKQAPTVRLLARARSTNAARRALLSPDQQIGGGLPAIAAGILASIVVPL